MTLLHEHPEKVPTFGDWVCSCDPCTIAVRASATVGTHYIIKGSTGRVRIDAATLAAHAADLDAYAEANGCGYVREVFVSER